MISIYLAYLGSWDPTQENYERLVAHLNAQDQQRVARYRQKRDRLCFLVGRLLLYQHVAKQGVTIDKPLQLGFSGSGKPFLVEPIDRDRRLEFNISHDDNIVVLAARTVSKNDPLPGIGIDVMLLDRSSADLKDLEEVLVDQLQPTELTDINATGSELPAYIRTRHLIRVWTIKEAYTKAIGTGLGTEFRELCIRGLPSIYEESFLIPAMSTAVGSTRISMYKSAQDPILTSPSQPEWTINHGHFAIRQSNTIGEEHVCEGPGMGVEKRFAWSLVYAGHAGGKPVAIDFSIVDPRDLEALWRE